MSNVQRTTQLPLAYDEGNSQQQFNRICSYRSFRSQVHHWTPFYSNGAHCKYNFRKKICRALLDSGSQLSFITEDAVQRLGLKRSSQSLTINGIGNVTKSYNSGSVKLDIQTEDRGIVNVIAYLLPKLTQFLPSSQFSLQNCFHIRSVKLADTDFNKPRKIEIILGSDVFEDLVLDGKFIDGNGLHFRNTVFGWIASGKHSNTSKDSTKVTSSVCINNTFDLRKFWELEEIPMAKTFTTEEMACKKHFVETTKIENNRFVEQLPFKEDAKPLGDTYLQAKRRFLSLEKRLQSNPKLKEGYSNFIQEFVDLEHLEKVPPDEIEKPNDQQTFCHTIVSKRLTQRQRSYELYSTDLPSQIMVHLSILH